MPDAQTISMPARRPSHPRRVTTFLPLRYDAIARRGDSLIHYEISLSPPIAKRVLCAMPRLCALCAAEAARLRRYAQRIFYTFVVRA